MNYSRIALPITFAIALVLLFGFVVVRSNADYQRAVKRTVKRAELDAEMGIRRRYIDLRKNERDDKRIYEVGTIFRSFSEDGFRLVYSRNLDSSLVSAYNRSYEKLNQEQNFDRFSISDRQFFQELKVLQFEEIKGDHRKLNSFISVDRTEGLVSVIVSDKHNVGRTVESIQVSEPVVQVEFGIAENNQMVVLKVDMQYFLFSETGELILWFVRD